MYCQSLRWLSKIGVISVTHYAPGRFRRLMRLEVVLLAVRLVVRLAVVRLLATGPTELQFLSVTSWRTSHIWFAFFCHFESCCPRAASPYAFEPTRNICARNSSSFGIFTRKPSTPFKNSYWLKENENNENNNREIMLYKHGYLFHLFCSKFIDQFQNTFCQHCDFSIARRWNVGTTF